MIRHPGVSIVNHEKSKVKKGDDVVYGGSAEHNGAQGNFVGVALMCGDRKFRAKQI